MLSQLLSRTVTVRTLLLGALWTLPCVGMGFVAGQHATPQHAATGRAVQRPSDAMAVATHPGSVSQSSSADKSHDDVFGQPYGEPKASAPAVRPMDRLGEPNGAGVETYRMPGADGKETIVVIIREDGRRPDAPSLR